MSIVNPVSEDFMYCDPEIIMDDEPTVQFLHACQFCYVVDALAATDEEIRRLRNEQG